MRPLLLGIAVLVSGVGCESAIVGSECRAPLVRCGRYCVDLASDGLNCGACGNACVFGCSNATCTLGDAAVVPDAGRDAGRDGGNDAGFDAGHDAGSDAGSDAGLDSSLVDGGPRCGLGELLCGTACVDPRDGAHCGDCTTTCGAAEVCTAAGCMPSCGAETACGSRCVDLASDTHFCGDCATDCGSDVCAASACVTPRDGHLVVIGHDYELRRMDMSRIVANAVLLPARSPVRVLAFEGDATAAGIAGTLAALADATGPGTIALTATSDVSAVPVGLEQADTFLVYAQTGASDGKLREMGYAWGEALREYLDRGGVIVVLDAPSLTNGGTHQLLDAAGLFHATATSELSSPRLVAATGHESDAVLVGVTFPYNGERHTVRISSIDPSVIVTTGSAPVVFHRVVTD